MLLCWCQTSSSPPLESLRSVCTPCCCSAQRPASSHDSLSDAACTRLHISVMCLAFSSLAQIIQVPWLRFALHTCSQARGYLVNNLYDPAQGGSQQGFVAIVPWIARVQGHRLADNILHSAACFSLPATSQHRVPYLCTPPVMRSSYRESVLGLRNGGLRAVTGRTGLAALSRE